jgi:hypothetical protein
MGRVIRPQGRVFLAKSGVARYQVQAFSASLPEAPAWSAAIAQLVEHVIRNDGVTGSNPVCGTSFFEAESAGKCNQKPDWHRTPGAAEQPKAVEPPKLVEAPKTVETSKLPRAEICR